MSASDDPQPAAPAGRPEAERPAPSWLPQVLAALLALAACGWLIQLAAESRWVLDADEAVHAVEALRRFERLEQGQLGQFLVDSYLPERWQPPVQDHVRWYGIVHSWSMLPGFFLFGPGDFSARLPSILYLLGSCAVFFALARRLAPRGGDWSGLFAVAFLLSAPNVVTFAPQSLTEACVFFWCHLALFCYLRFVEAPAQRARALWAGACMAVAVLAKYDHGLLLVACLGLAELVRGRARVPAMLRSNVAWMFAVPLVAFGLWLAHPDKLAAFRDTLAHPAYGSWRVIAANVPASLVLEYSSSLGALLLVLAAVLDGARRLRDPALRGVWIYGVLACGLLIARARFQFRYNLIEVPVLFLLAAALLPSWVAALSARMAELPPRRRLWGAALLGSGAAVLAGLWLLARRPDGVGAALEFSLGALMGLSSDAFGLTQSAASYAHDLTRVLGRALLVLDVSLATLALALLCLGAWTSFARTREREPHARLLIAALALATVPAAAAFWRRAESMIRWEWESTPLLHDVLLEVTGRTPHRARLLLAGGWDQLTNNTLAWHLKTRYLHPRPPYDELQVVGDMIGSLVLPEEPRIEYWAEVLRAADHAQLPERVVILEPRADFLYREVLGPESALYRALLEQRGAYELALERSFEELGLELEIWSLLPTPVAALERPTGPAAAVPVEPTGRSTRGRWNIGDKAWRHLSCPWLK